jgi:hypothetical protein
MREIFLSLFDQFALLDTGVLGHGGHRPPGQHHHRPQDLPGGHVRIRLRLRVRSLRLFLLLVIQNLTETQEGRKILYTKIILYHSTTVCTVQWRMLD